jgi:hypothetical protein
MKRGFVGAAMLSLLGLVFASGCKREAKHDEAAEAPPKATVERAGDAQIFEVNGMGRQR